jgi:hypothetical protein
MSLRTAFAAALVALSTAACSGAGLEAAPEAVATSGAALTSTSGAEAVQCPVHPPKVEDGRLMVFDEAKGEYAPFFVKGIAYSPEASSFVHPTKSGPAGTMCRESANLGTEQGRFTLPSCFDSDYAGNLVSQDGSRVVNGDFRAAWLRDMKIMKQMGINTIRLYNANPQFRDHKQFLDDAKANGMMVTMPAWFIPDNSSPGWPFERTESRGYDLPIRTGIDKQLAEVAAHPAVLMWTVGNELVPDYQRPDALGKFRIDRIGKIMDQLHSVCDGKLLVTNVPQDLGDDAASWEAYASTFPQQDVLTVNSGYRGDVYGGNSYDKLWPLVEGVTAKHHKPFVIGETGEYDHIKLGGSWFDGLTEHVKDHPSVAGLVFFEYSDEPLAKTNFGANSDNQEQHMGVVRLERDPQNPALDKVVVRQERFDMIKRAFAK